MAGRPRGRVLAGVGVVAVLLLTGCARVVPAAGPAPIATSAVTAASSMSPSAPTATSSSVTPSPSATTPTPDASTPSPTAPSTPALVAGPAIYRPGSKGDAVRDVQVRLRQLAWYSGVITGTYDAQTVSGVQGFQTKRGFPVTGEVDRRTLDKLVSMTRTPTANEKNNVIAPVTATGRIDPRCMTDHVLCIDKTTRKLRWMVDGQVARVFDVRFGSELSPTREGSFTVYWKSRDHVSTIYHTAMPFAMFFSGGQAIHYSADFAARGYNGSSHGCVNVRDYNGIAWLFDQVGVGTSVIVYRS